jgi:hypothetical protein
LHGDLLYKKLKHVVFEKVGEYPRVLVVNDVFDHKVDRPYLVVVKCNIDCASSILVLVEYGEFIAKIFFILVTQEFFDGPAIEGKIRNHVLEAELQEHFEEYLRIWLFLDQYFDITLCFARIDTLNQQKFPKSYLKYLDFEYVIEIGLTCIISPLILKADLAFVIKLAGEEEMVSLLDLQVVA